MLNSNQFERIEVYLPQGTADDPFTRFKKDSGNASFRRSRLTFVSLFFLLILYPVMSIGFTGDPTSLLKSLTDGMRMILLLTTIFMQRCIFFLLLLSTLREQTLLSGVGLRKIRTVDFFWAIGFLLASNAILSGLAWLLAQIGLPMPGEISLLIPQDTVGRIVWVGVSFTAGFCEEVAFRGYLMTRLRLLGKLRNWVIPVIVSSVMFGACHAYQGWPGFIVISVYGILFAALYIRTGTLWPCIIAHSLQDLGALFYPQ